MDNFRRKTLKKEEDRVVKSVLYNTHYEIIGVTDVQATMTWNEGYGYISGPIVHASIVIWGRAYYTYRDYYSSGTTKLRYDSNGPGVFYIDVSSESASTSIIGELQHLSSFGGDVECDFYVTLTSETEAWGYAECDGVTSNTVTCKLRY